MSINENNYCLWPGILKFPNPKIYRLRQVIYQNAYDEYLNFSAKTICCIAVVTQIQGGEYRAFLRDSACAGYLAWRSEKG